MRSRRCAVLRLVVALFAAFLGTPSLAAQDAPSTGDQPSAPEAPLPLRIPQNAPPSPEVPLPDTSPLMRDDRIKWTGDIDPDLSWIGAPWDYLPPIDEEEADAGSAAAAPVTTPSQNPSAQSSPPAARPTPSPTPNPAATPPETSPGREQTTQPSSGPSASGSPLLPEIAVSVDEITAISLPETGWIYVGAIPPDTDIDLIESQSGAGETLFRFRPRQNGDILLSFQRQDMVTGSFEEYTILLSVLEEGAPLPEPVAMPDRGTVDDDEEAPEQPRTPPPPRELEVTTDGDGDYREARILLAEGRREDALESFLQHFDGAGTPELRQEIASLADDTGYGEIANYFWELNLSLPSEQGSAARRGLAERRVTTAPVRDLEEFFTLAQRYDDMPPARRLFEWARFYDADGPSPDVRRALLLYTTLTEWYPGAPEAPEAERRLRFLRRHFLEIR